MKHLKILLYPTISAVVVFLFGWLAGAKFFEPSMNPVAVAATIMFFLVLGVIAMEASVK